MEQIKATVGDDEFSAALAESFTPLLEIVPGDDLVAKIHNRILAEPISDWQRF